MTRKIRQFGTMKASIVDANDEFAHAFDQLKAAVLPTNPSGTSFNFKALSKSRNRTKYRRDRFWLETQHSKRELSQRNCNLTILPYNTTAQEISGSRARWCHADQRTW